MDHLVHLLVAKVSALVLLGLLVTACGLSIEDDEAKAGDSGTNRLIARSDGPYAMQLNTKAMTCRVDDDFALRRMEYRHEARAEAGQDPDEGLELMLEVFGAVETGDALTSDNASEGRYFTFMLVTPDGALYDYSSLGPAASSALAALTVLRATDFELSTRLQAERLSPVGGVGETLSFRGSFDCNVWRGGGGG